MALTARGQGIFNLIIIKLLGLSLDSIRLGHNFIFCDNILLLVRLNRDFFNRRPTNSSVIVNNNTGWDQISNRNLARRGHMTAASVNSDDSKTSHLTISSDSVDRN